MVEIYLPKGRKLQDSTDPLLQPQPINVEEELKGEGENLEVPLPQTCDVKEALIVKLQELDVKVYMLIKSNKQIREELGEDPEMETYIEENDKIIVRTKDEILRILNAFLAAGIDIDKENVL